MQALSLDKNYNSSSIVNGGKEETMIKFYVDFRFGNKKFSIIFCSCIYLRDSA